MNENVEILSDRQVRQKTILSFLLFFLFLAVCVAGWKLLQSQPKEQGTLKPLRSTLETNESVFISMFGNRLSKNYPKESAVPKVRLNGVIGLNNDFDAANWKLQVIRNDGDTLFVGIDEIRKLPRTEIVFDFKCIEGWSQVTRWAGVRFSDFVKYYGLTDETKMAFAGLVTPDKDYYVGLDMKSMLHSQTLLCYEVNGDALPMKHGYPLRLIVPVKYGVKHIKRIGTLSFSNARPPDYWYERGYDYYCGL